MSRTEMKYEKRTNNAGSKFQTGIAVLITGREKPEIIRNYTLFREFGRK
jgi:hypothetical protein